MDYLHYLEQSIDVLNLNVRARNCLKSADIHCIKDLISKKLTDIWKIPNLGMQSIDNIRLRLYDAGLSLQDEQKYTEQQIKSYKLTVLEDTAMEHERNLSNDLKDHFAGLAMASYLKFNSEEKFSEIALLSYCMADEMIKTRNQILKSQRRNSAKSS
jgi:hypothetical protein